MPYPIKIYEEKLRKLLKEGKNQREIAKILRVSEPSVSAAVQKLKLNTTKNITLETGYRAVKDRLDAIVQLNRINQVANQLLDELTGKENTINQMTKAVEKFIEFEQNPTKDNSKKLKNILSRINQDKNTAIKACAEIRGQLNLQLEIFKTLYDIEAIAEFQRVVIEAIGEAAPAVRKTIIQNLKKRKALRESVTFPQLRRDL